MDKRIDVDFISSMFEVPENARGISQNWALLGERDVVQVSVSWWKKFFTYIDNWFMKDIETMLDRSKPDKEGNGGLNFSILLLILIGMELLGFIISNGKVRSEEYKDKQKEKLKKYLEGKGISIKLIDRICEKKNRILSLKENTSQITFNEFWNELIKKYPIYKVEIREILWSNRNKSAHNFFFDSKIQVCNNSKQHLKTEDNNLVISNNQLFIHWKEIYEEVKKNVLKNEEKFECARNFLQNKLN